MWLKLNPKQKSILTTLNLSFLWFDTWVVNFSFGEALCKKDCWFACNAHHSTASLQHLVNWLSSFFGWSVDGKGVKRTMFCLWGMCNVYDTTISIGSNELTCLYDIYDTNAFKICVKVLYFLCQKNISYFWQCFRSHFGHFQTFWPLFPS